LWRRRILDGHGILVEKKCLIGQEEGGGGGETESGMAMDGSMEGMAAAATITNNCGDEAIWLLLPTLHRFLWPLIPPHPLLIQIS
jgi:hypothetical protein